MADKGTKKAADSDAEDGKAAKKSGKVKIILIVVVVALAGGAYVIGKGSAAAPTGADAGPTTTTTIPLIGGCLAEPEPGAPEMVVNMAEMSINLDAGHYLRVAVSLGLCADVVLESPEAFMSAPAQDIVVSTLSGSKMEDLATAEGRELAKSKLTELISAAYPGVVYEVFFVEFVMQ